jgi:HlyD family secretion protein
MLKKIFVRVTVVAVLGTAGWGAWRLYSRMPQRTQQQIPTARVRQGDVVVRTFSRAELRAVRSTTLVAPNLFGTVQITKLAPLGSFAREKDLVVEFDDSEVVSQMEEKQLEIEQNDEQIKKSQAELAIRNNQDQVELLRARYAVRRAELEVKRNDLIAPIDAKRNLLNLEEAKRRLQQLESDIKSRQEQAQAELATLNERKNKAVVELGRWKLRLSQTKLLAPMSGLVAIRQQRSGFGGRGVQPPDIREGDQVPPGSQVADVMDISEMEAVARVVELDRANLHEGQDVVLRLDALPEKQLNGKIKALSGTASANVFGSDPTKRFEVVFSVDMRQLLSSLGARPEQIQRVLAQAEHNRRRPAPAGMSGMFAGGGPPAMLAAGGPPGAAVEFQVPGGRGGRGGGFGGGGFGGGGGMSDEQRQQMREAMQKALGGRNLQDLSEEERRKLFESVRGGRGGGQAGGAPGERGEGERKRGRRPEGGGDDQQVAQVRGGRGGEGGDAQGGPGGRGGRRGGGEGGPAMFSTASQFSEADLQNAKLPPPPEQDNQLDVLLRPGLLADVEIIVDRIPNAIYVPVQALFEKGGRQVVYVREASGFQERVVKPLRRNESAVAIASGLKPGEIVALSDPTERPGDRKKKKEADPGAGGGGAMPMGGGKS